MSLKPGLHEDTLFPTPIPGPPKQEMKYLRGDALRTLRVLGAGTQVNSVKKDSPGQPDLKRGLVGGRKRVTVETYITRLNGWLMGGHLEK